MPKATTPTAGLDATGKPIPATSMAQLLKYNTGLYFCQCRDFKRGGSYYCPVDGDRICKHVHKKRGLQAELEQQNAQAPAIPVMPLIAPAFMVWVELDTEASARQINTHNAVCDMLG